MSEVTDVDFAPTPLSPSSTLLQYRAFRLEQLRINDPARYDHRMAISGPRAGRRAARIRILQREEREAAEWLAGQQTLNPGSSQP